jgi:hypothetical protein
MRREKGICLVETNFTQRDFGRSVDKRSGTFESKADFVHKLAIAQKEINETIYWLELLCETGYVLKDEFESLNGDAVEIIKMLTSSIKTVKQKLTTNRLSL